jgi:TonB family protein
MSLTQIPLQAPPPAAPPPEKNLPEQGDLFDAGTWESAYREMHDFPTLLIQARDELARSRKREAFWMSLVAHFVLILLFANSNKLAKYLPHRTVMIVANSPEKKDLTFLELPPDAQKVIKPPKTNVLSDKARIAESHTPKIDQQQLKKLLDAMKAGRQGPAPQPQQPPAVAQAQPPQPQPQPKPPEPTTTAKLQSPPMQQQPRSPFEQRPMSAEQAINQAAQQAASNRSRYGTGDEGDMGLGQRQPTARVGPYEITSDTMGVDFGPYMQRVLHDVRQNWYAIIPESAMPPLLKKGKVSIEFVILKNGQIAGMRYVFPSGDVALDRAAYGGITASNPFPPLPKEFAGQYLGLRFTFYYNPDRNQADLQ